MRHREARAMRDEAMRGREQRFIELHQVKVPLPGARPGSFYAQGPNGTARIQWVEDQSSWMFEVRYRHPKDHRVKIFVPEGHTSPVVVTALTELERVANEG